MIQGDGPEIKKFMTSIENDKEIIDNFRIYVQGAVVPIEDARPGTIAAYARVANSHIAKPSTTFYPVVEKIDIPNELSGPELDNYFPEWPVILVEDQRGNKIAYVDANGIVYTCDFYHYSTRFRKELKKILEIAKDYNTIVQETTIERTIRMLREMDTEKIQKVVITTEFDKELCIKNAELRIRDAIRSIEAIKDAQLRAAIAAKQKEIDRLKEEIEQIRGEAVVTMIKLYDQPFMKNWRVDGDWLVYNDTIYVTKIKKNNTVYTVDSNKMYIKGLRVRIVPHVFDEDVHFESVYHPNALDNICLGDLEGAELLKILNELPETLQIANMDSHFSNSASMYASEYIKKLEESGAGGTTVWGDERWEVA